MEFSDEDIEIGRKLFLGDRQFIKSCVSLDTLPSQNISEIAFFGRSNVGKSSLINSLTNKKKLAKFSKTPGRTKQLNFFKIENKLHSLNFVDFPGYGFSKISKDNEFKLNKLVNLYIKKRKNICKFFILIDSLHGFKKIDKDIISQLNILIEKKIFIVFTKLDRLKNKCQHDQLKNFNEIADKKLNKKFFNTSIKQVNTIILLKKFLMNS